MQNVYSEFLSDRLQELDPDEIPKDYKNAVEKNRKSNQKPLLKEKSNLMTKCCIDQNFIRYFYEN